MNRCLIFLMLCLAPCVAQGEVLNSSSDGFQIQITRQLDVDAGTAYSKLVEEFSMWYDASHSYSGEAANLSLDLEEKCMLERLPDGGYVRHMEIVFHQPGKVFRMTGGLGPLQGMGVTGALTYEFVEGDEGTEVKMTYNVSGASSLQLDAIAVPVNQVLGLQMDRFANHCNNDEGQSP